MRLPLADPPDLAATVAMLPVADALRREGLADLQVHDELVLAEAEVDAVRQWSPARWAPRRASRCPVVDTGVGPQLG